MKVEECPEGIPLERRNRCLIAALKLSTKFFNYGLRTMNYELNYV